MTTPIPFDVFASELLPAEKIEWSGQPNPAVIFHPEDWGFVPFTLLWGGFAIFWVLAASGVWDFPANRSTQPFSSFGLFGLPFVVIGQYMIWGRFVYAWWLKKRTFYALTNRRMLIVSRGLKGRSVSSAYFEGLAIIDKQIRADGNGRISFGGPVNGEMRWGKGNPPRPPTFDDVDNADGVYRIAMQLLEDAHKKTESSTARWN